MKDALQNLSKLPSFCYVCLDGLVVTIRRGAKEPTPITYIRKDAIAAQNAKLGVTEAQVKAMVVGVTLGWDMDGADPDTHLPPDEKLPEGPFNYEYDTSIDIIVRVSAHAEELAANEARDRVRELVVELDRWNPFPNTILSFAADSDVWLQDSNDPREQ